MNRKSDVARWGDFQTPLELARRCCAKLDDLGCDPCTVLEPTCGRGSFLLAAAETFRNARVLRGLEIQECHAAQARESLSRAPRADKLRTSIDKADFFHHDWDAEISVYEQPVLVLGNPPWVTNSALARMAQDNRPARANSAGMRGIEAATGRSNFDISEWMLLDLAKRLSGKCATMAFLVKHAVARRVLHRSWKEGLQLGSASLFGIDAYAEFGACVDAALLVMTFEPNCSCTSCEIHDSLDSLASSRFGSEDGLLVSDVDRFRHGAQFLGPSSQLRWRSGVKHDCAKVMELKQGADGKLRNGYGSEVDVEEELVFPMMKSSEIAKSGFAHTGRYMLVPQRSTGEDTSLLQQSAPKAWSYLLAHAKQIDRRGSSIYLRRPRFSIFGVGPYTFAPFKVAISSLYKSLEFRVIGPVDGKPVVVDDTTNLLACETETQARLLQRAARSPDVQGLLESMIFWDAKRPVTIEVLNRIDWDSQIRLGSASTWLETQKEDVR